MEIPSELVKAVVAGRLPHSDIGVYLSLLCMQNGGKVHGSIEEMATSLRLSRSTYIQTMKRLHAAGLVTYNPSDTRYIQSEVRIIGAESIPMNHQDNSQTDEAVSSEDFDPGLSQSTESTTLVESCNEERSKGLKTLRPSRAKFEQDSPPHQLSEKLLISIRKHLDPKRRADLQDWALHIDRLIRLDGRSAEDIDRVIYWLFHCESPDAQFWRPNILSTRKLREKFPLLVARMSKDKFNTWKPRREPEGKVCPTCHGAAVVTVEHEDGTVTGKVCPDCVKGRVQV